MRIRHGGDVFEVARARGWDWRDVLDFSASINPLGPSPRVREALHGALDRIVHYPDRYAETLTARLAPEWDVTPEQILCGNGATELIHFLARTWEGPPPALLVPTFSEFFRAWPSAPHYSWSRPQEWPLGRMLIATQPNNPTGELMPAEWLAQRGQAMLIDESFLDFTTHPTAIREGCFVLRSLTKFQALPGLRIGALVGPAGAIAKLKERREPWQVNALAEAGALAALEDSGHAERSRAFTASERARLRDEYARFEGLTLSNSQANYLFATLEYSASRLCAWMLERKVLLRNCTGEPGITGECVRFAIRSRQDNDRLASLWKEYPCAS